MPETLVGPAGVQMLAMSILEVLESTKNFLLVFLGFSAVIFVHECGHFFAAKLCKVKIDRFAVGFLTTLASYRKGLGFRWGSSEKEYKERLRAHAGGGRSGEASDPTDEEMERAGLELKLGETEYCFNALPLGGYVKMLGQEDFAIDKSGELAVKQHPRAFTHKPVSQRMFIVSSGVIMNLVFAAFVFMIVFMVGMKAPSAEVGAVMPDQPAHRAGLRTGDLITHINGREISDRQDLVMAIALSKPYEPAVIQFLRKDAATGEMKSQTLEVRPEIAPGDDQVRIGVGTPMTTEIALAAPDPLLPPDKQLQKGDKIIAASGQPIIDFSTISLLTANAGGDWIDLTVRRPQPGGSPKEVPVRARSRLAFAATGKAGELDENLLGLVPRRTWGEILDPDAKPSTELRRGDVIVRWGGVLAPRMSEIRKSISENPGREIQVVVQREGQEKPITVQAKARPRWGGDPVEPLLRQVFWMQEFGPPVVADVVTEVTPEIKTPAAALKDVMPRGSRLTKINDQAVDSWPQVLRRFVELAGQDVKLSWVYEQTPEQSATIHVPQTLDTTLKLPFARSIVSIGGKNRVDVEVNGRRNSYDMNSPLGQRTVLKDLVGQTVPVEYASLLESGTKTAQVQVTAEMLDNWTRRIEFQGLDQGLDVIPFPKLTLVRHRNPIKAMGVGVMKTYYFIESVIVMMDRMVVTRSVGMDQVAGPVGIVKMGGGMASMGIVYLLYFLALISANLAVINFMPLPIMDGGLFVFLLIEWIKGKPISLRVQVATQLIGLVLIVGIFLIVTVKDIVNW